MAFFKHFQNNIKKGWAATGTKFGWKDYAVLGVPPAICLGIYVWKRDTEDMQPVRDKRAAKAQQKAIAAASAGGEELRTEPEPQTNKPRVRKPFGSATD